MVCGVAFTVSQPGEAGSVRSSELLTKKCKRATNLACHLPCQGRDPQTSASPPRPNAIDAAIQIATGVMTDRSARHRTRPEHDAGPRHATGRIADVLAVHDGLGWRRAECETCKPQQGASSNPGNCR